MVAIIKPINVYGSTHSESPSPHLDLRWIHCYTQHCLRGSSPLVILAWLITLTYRAFTSEFITPQIIQRYGINQKKNFSRLQLMMNETD